VTADSNKATVDGAARPGIHDDRLYARLDAPLPRELSIGAGTALFVCGTCFHRDHKISSLSVLVDGVEQRVIAHGMPRLDLFRALHPGLDPYASARVSLDPEAIEDPHLRAYLSGFWGLARIPARTEANCELVLSARLHGGARATAPLTSLSVATDAVPIPVVPWETGATAAPKVAVCMATFEPRMELFRAQVASIRSQTHRDWVCFVSDDCSSPGAFAAIERELAGDPQFHVSRSSRRLGFYLNFERALRMVPRTADYVALADQDDRWYPDKLESLLAEIGDAQLVYSDARVIDRDGGLISPTYWSSRRNNHTDLLSLLVANSVTGAASLFRRDLLDYALPFPPPQFAHFHDHWIGLTALALGDIAFVDRPLYDYVQHRDAALGHAAANRMVGMRERLASLKADPRERVRMWRLHYFVDVSRLTVCATTLLLRCGERIAPAKRRTLERFLRTDRSLSALADLWRRGARELVGHTETLGAEWMLAHAFTWRRLLAASVRESPVRGLRLDAVPPPDLALAHGHESPDSPTTRAIAEKIAPLEIAVSDRAPWRVNLLIPTVDLGHFFGGYIGKLNLARRLADRGVRVRIVTVDPVGPLPQHWKHAVESYSGLTGLFDKVEFAFGREARDIEVSRNDAFIATTWWTAHIAHSARESLGRDGFLYLIQEYEPFTFPMGTHAALASGSYQLPHRALFSTELLQDYFRHHRIGVYSDGAADGDARSASFQNAITRIEPPSLAELKQRHPRRLLFYGRPEAHASRNMFDLGLLALQRALEDGTFSTGWELHGIGTTGAARTIALGGGVNLRLLPRSDQNTYATLLRDHDLGLALMYTPHPSLVPIEMASAGMLTVTNTFENKTQDAMTAISSNLIAPPPTINGIADALRNATAAVEDYERRVRSSSVSWSRDWDQSFADELIDRVMSFLEF
jgi:glycosyltransferase involved in cell wall biosynthesis